MTRDSMMQRTMRRLLGCAAVSTTLVSAVGAQAPAPGTQRVGDAAWRIGASVGGFSPRSALVASDASNRETSLEAGPSFSLDVQYVASSLLSIYANGTGAFSAISLGSAIQPIIQGPSLNATVIAGTAGLMLSPVGSGYFKPTIRLGGGLKGYRFNLTGADGQFRPTGDIGIGFRGMGSGPIEISAEMRYLPSTFDQGRLPIRGITPQAQRQTDLIFGIGVSIRP
jgi:hypothetical protein